LLRTPRGYGGPRLAVEPVPDARLLFPRGSRINLVRSGGRLRVELPAPLSRLQPIDVVTENGKKRSPRVARMCCCRMKRLSPNRAWADCLATTSWRRDGIGRSKLGRASPGRAAAPGDSHAAGAVGRAAHFHRFGMIAWATLRNSAAAKPAGSLEMAGGRGGNCTLLSDGQPISSKNEKGKVTDDVLALLHRGRRGRDRLHRRRVYLGAVSRVRGRGRVPSERPIGCAEIVHSSRLLQLIDVKAKN